MEVIRVESADRAALADRERRLQFGAQQRQTPIRGRIVGVHGYVYDVLIPGRAHPYGGVPTSEPVKLELGSVVWLGFIEDNPGLPFILAFRAESTTRMLGEKAAIPLQALTGTWHRYGLRTVGRYWSPEEHELRSTGAVPAEVSRAPGHALRATGYGLWWADNASSVGYLDRESGGEPTSTDLGAAVIALWHSGAGAWALTEGDGGGNHDTGYSDGYAAGVAAAEPPASFAALNAGEAACLGETGYDVWGYPYEARDEEDPGSGAPAYREGYAAGYSEGYAARWKELYDYGYAYFGCEVPDE